MEIKAQLEEVKNALGERFEGEVKALGDKFDAAMNRQAEELKKFGQVSDETKTKIEEAETKLADLIEGAAEQKGRLDGLEAAFNRPGAEGGTEERKTPGQTFIESDEWNSFLKRKGASESDAVSFKSLETKDLTSDRGTAFGQLGGLITPQELATLRDPRKELTIRDLMRVIPTTSDTVHYVQVTGFRNLYAKLTSAASAAATSIVVDRIQGFFAGQAIIVNGESKVVSAVNTSTRTITLTSGLAGAAAIGAEVVSDQVGFTQHGEEKPQANLKMVEKSHPVGTVAHWIPAHRQTLADAPQIRGIVDSELLYGLELVEEYQILKGNGASPNLTGILNTTGVQDKGTMTGAGIQQLDWIRKAITLAQIAMWPPNGVVMHPTDVEAIDLLKDNNGNYLRVDVANGGENRVWRLPIVVTTAIDSGTFLLGSFGMGAYLLDREDANIRVAEQHSDYFTRNMVAILAEERLGLACTRPESFVKGRFA